MSKELKQLFQKLRTKVGLETAFNISLVYADARPACLIEKANYFSGTGLTPRDYIRDRKFLQNFVWNKYQLHFLDVEIGIIIYKGELPNLTTETAFGKSLGFDCPGELDGSYVVSFNIEDASQSENCYAEICRQANTAAVEAKLDKFRKVAKILGLKVTSEVRKFYKIPELINHLKSQHPVSREVIHEIANMFWNHGLFYSVKLAEKVISRKIENYRPAIQDYIPVWIVLLAYCENDPIINLFGRLITRRDINVTWEDVNRQLGVWELSIYG